MNPVSRRILHCYVTADLDGFPPWVAINLREEERRVLDVLIARQHEGESPSLPASAREAGVNAGTARAWKGTTPGLRTGGRDGPGSPPARTCHRA